MRIVLYARKSTESDDRQVQSLEDQIRALIRIAEYERLEIVEIIQESKSAKAPGIRPEFNRMLGMIYSGQVNGILTWAINRLSRNPVDGGQLAYMLQTKQLAMIRTADRTYLPDDNALLLSIENGISTAYLQDLSRNVTRGMQGKIDRGWLTCKAPMGYLNNPITREIDIDPDRFPLIKEAWERLIVDRMPVRHIHKYLVDRGMTISNRHGSEKPPSIATVYKMFQNPFYCGKISYKGAEYPGKHEPMITPGEFAWAQRVMEGSSSNAKSLDKKFPYSGVFKCEECGCAVVGERKFKAYRTTGRTAEYIYYHCSGHKGCSKIGIRQHEISTQLEEMMQVLKIPAGFGGWLKDALMKSLNQNQLDADTQRGSVEEELEKLSRKRRQLTLMKLDREISQSEFADLRTELENEEQRLKRKLTYLTEARSRMIQFGHKLIDAAIEAGELPADRSNLGIMGGIAARLGDHTISKGKLNLNPHEFNKRIALFEPSIHSTEAPKWGDSVLNNSIWWALVDDLLNLLIVADTQNLKS